MLQYLQEKIEVGLKREECVNSDCTEIFYVEDSKLDLPLQCEKCITKKNI